MSGIFIGNATKVFYNNDAGNNIPNAPSYVEVDQLADFPEVKIVSSTQSYTTYADEYTSILASNKDISAVNIVVNYMPDNVGHIYLDNAFKNSNKFQIKVSLYESLTSLEQHYAIINGYISSTNVSGGQNAVTQKTYVFTAEDIVARGTAQDMANLKVGDYGVGANGSAEIPQYESATPDGNAFIKVPSDQALNPSGVDMLGIAGVDGANTTKFAITETGTLKLYAKNQTSAWTNIPLKVDNDALYVPLTRTVNGKALSGNISLTPADIGLSTPTAAFNINAQPLRGDIPTAGVDINTYGPTADFVGLWRVNSSAQVTGSSNLPEAVTGTLEVLQSGAFAGGQRYTTRYGNMYVRSLTATWTAASPNVWGPWIPVGNHVNSTFFTGDLNTLIVPGDYAVTATATNGPWPDTSGVAGRIRVETRTPTVTTTFGDVTQTFTIFTTSNANKNRMWKRTYQSSASTWGGWSEYAQTGDSVGDNYIRNPGFLSAGFLQAISNATTASLEYVNNTDSRVPAGCSGARVAVITKIATGTLNQLNFGVDNDQNTNYIAVAPGQILNYSVNVAGTGFTANTQLRVVIVTYNGSTFMANNRVASYDGATGGWQTLSGAFTVPANCTQVYFGIWNETTAPTGSVAFITEPSLKKADSGYVASNNGTAAGTLTNTYRITQSRTDANPPYITWNRADQVDGTPPATATQVGFLQTMLTSATDGTPYARSLGQMSMWHNTGGGGIVYLGARNASSSTTSQLKLDGELSLATFTGAVQVNSTLSATGTIDRTGSGTVSFLANRTNSGANSYFSAKTTAGQIYFGTGSGTNFVVNNTDSNSSAWLSMDGTTAGFSGAITAPTATLSTSLTVPTANVTTLNLTNDLSIANGGTGASTAAAALSNLGAMPLAGGAFTGAVTSNSSIVTTGVMQSLSYRAIGSTNGVQNAGGTAVFDFSVSANTAAGNLNLARSGTGSFDIGGIPILNAGSIAFSSTANARQTLLNQGVSGNVSYVRIPISTTQAYQIVSVTAVQTQNSSGDSTITFPVAFTTINNVVCSNGDGAVGNLTFNIINSIRAAGFDVRVYNNGTAQTGSVRVNYIATGLVNI